MALALLIDTYLADAASKLTRLVELVDNRQGFDEAARIAHSLKSASAMAGASALSQLAARVEMGLSQDTSVIDADVTIRMQQHLTAYRAALIERGLAA